MRTGFRGCGKLVVWNRFGHALRAASVRRGASCFESYRMRAGWCRMIVRCFPGAARGFIQPRSV